MSNATRPSEPGSLACPVYFGASPPAHPSTASWRPIAELSGARAVGAAVVLVDRTMLGDLEGLRRLPSHVALVPIDAESESALGESARLSLAGISDPSARIVALRAACELACARYTAVRRWRLMAKSNRERDELIAIGMDLMHEHDRPTLLQKILTVGKEFTQSDAGVLFLTKPGSDPPSLCVALYEFDSLPDLPPMLGRLVPIDNNTIIGHAALAGKPIAIADAYDLPPGSDFASDGSFDIDYGYRRRSMLLVPMIDQRGHGVGVLVFVNRKTDRTAEIHSKADADRYVIAYTAHEVRLARSLAGEAAVAIENARLYGQIEQTLESFVKASVSAIDQRDPTTSGHSVRVAALAAELATAVDHEDTGPYRNVHFTRKQMRELRFAALLHDFGKIAVRDEVLLKEKKLPPVLNERVRDRFLLIHRTLELDHLKAVDDLRERGVNGDARKRVESSVTKRFAELERLRELVATANEPSSSVNRDSQELQSLARLTFQLPDGTTCPYLTDEELHYLQIQTGNLDPHERALVEEHVTETFAFLSRIPWTEDLMNVAPFAYAHHEKLSGTGYPRHLRGDAIPIQARMITIADMFDALTEADRPYKPSVSVDRAMDILREDAKRGLLDGNLVQLMVDAAPYKRIVESDWRML